MSSTNATLPACPDFMKCTITKSRMQDPVIAQDAQTYERAAILEWFNNGNTISPTTKAPMTSAVMANDRLKQAIQQWVQDNSCENGDAQQLERLKMDIFSVTAADAALSILQQLLDLVTKSEYLLLSPSEADSFKGLMGYVLNLSCFFGPGARACTFVFYVQIDGKADFYSLLFSGTKNY